MMNRILGTGCACTAIAAVLVVACTHPDRSTLAPATRSARVIVSGARSGAAPGAFRLEDASSGIALDVALRGVADVAPETQPDGSLLYRGAYAGADLVRATTADGVEDFISFPTAPAAAEVDYDLALGTGIAGLRLVAGTLEVLDASGDPRLRVSPPFLTTADGQVVAAAFSLDDCAADTDPRAPWGRATVTPGATACVLRVAWDATVAYPAVLDPSWASTDTLGTARTAHAAAVLPNSGQVLVAGGENSGGQTLNTAELYDPASSQWAATGSLHLDRRDATATALADGRVLVIGGLQKGNKGPVVLGSVERYDETTGLWSSITGTSPRYRHAAVRLGSGKVLAAGGYDGNGNALSSCDLYDPATNTIAPCQSPMTVARGDFTLTVLADGSALAVGGRATSTSATGLRSAERYDPAAGTWTPVASPMPGPRYGHVAAALANGGLLVAAGSDAVAYVFDGNAWVATGSAVGERYQATATTLRSGGVLVAGGATVPDTASAATLLATTAIFDPAARTWSAGPTLLAARAGHTASALSDRNVLAAGGVTASGNKDAVKPTITSERYLDPAARNGVACTSASDCASAFCTDGVCCDAACDGNCASCKVAGAEGTCTAVTSPRKPCPTDGTTCGAQRCDGVSLSCSLPGASVACGGCTDATDTRGSCDGAGACAVQSTTSCGAYVCGPMTCLSTCTSDDGCNRASDPYLFCIASACQQDRPPVLQLPSLGAIEATGPTGATVTFEATATDDRDGTLVPSCTPASPATFAVGDWSVVCSVKDGRGQQVTGSFAVVVKDSTPPTLYLPASFTKEATGQTTAVAWSATAFDVVDLATPVACTPTSGIALPLGEHPVTCTSSDTHGNTVTGTFTVTVVDSTPPALTIPPDLVVEATGPLGAAATFEVSAKDAVDPSPTLECSATSGSVFPLGLSSVQCTARDASGNRAEATFHVSVIDSRPPALTVPTPIVAEATGPGGAPVTFAATALDVVDPNPMIECAPASGSTFSLGETTVTCAATDFSRNRATGTFTVTVKDTTPPILALPADLVSATGPDGAAISALVAEATGAAGAVVTFDVTATDLVDTAPVVRCTPASGDLFPLGSTTVSCTATDASGNRAPGSFQVTVQDTTPPTVTVPKDFSVLATSGAGAQVAFSTSASDVVDGLVTTSCTPDSGTVLEPGTTTVTCTATDAHGNTGESAFSVSVNFAWSAFLQPISLGNPSVFKLGKTIPVKFKLLDALGSSAKIPDLTADLYVRKAADQSAGAVVDDGLSTVADAGTRFRYDATADQYVFNLSTSAGFWSRGTWKIGVDMHDGVVREEEITLTR